MNKSQNNQRIQIDLVALQNYVKNEKIIIVTCTGCSCFVDAMNSMPSKEVAYISQFPILTDTTCRQISFPTKFVSKEGIDSISTDIYNITLLKKEKDIYVSRILQLNESSKIVEIIKEFF